MKDNPILRSALWYLTSMKWSIIPQKKNKTPYIDWAPYQEALPSKEAVTTWFTKWPDAMIAVVTGKISGITVLDIDSQEGREAIEAMLPDDFRCPVTLTPRGGRHLYFVYNKSLVTRTQDMPGVDTKNDGGLITLPPSIGELGRAYAWVEALNIRRIPLPPVPLKYINAVSRPETPRYIGAGIGGLEIDFKQGRRDDTLFHTALTLAKGGMNPENIEKVLAHLAGACTPPFPKAEALIKVRSAVERAYKEQRNLAKEIREWVSVTSGIFSITDIYLALHIITPEDKNNARQILRRLKAEELIIPHGQKADVYRRIIPDYIEMDYKGIIPKPLDIDWPMDIGRYFYTYAKNIAIIAGNKDSGKTAMLIDFTKRNQNAWDIHYFSNEMAAEELSMRLRKHTDIKIDDWKFRAYEKASHFADVIIPDAINIIDYIEINKDFSLMGDYLMEIHERLDKGIAVIALQKKFNEEWGRGGQFSNQRPRLYVTLNSKGQDAGAATILVAKNRRGDLNPVGMSRMYRITDGWKITTEGDWGYLEEDEY
jgi:hypothetical protein